MAKRAKTPSPTIADRTAPHATDVAVVGAGPSGLVAAILAARAGWAVTLVAPVGRWNDRRTTALLAGSVEMLKRMGLWEGIAPKAQGVSVMRLVDDTGRLVRAPEVAFDCREIGLEAFGANIPNEDLNGALLAAVRETPGVTVLDATLADAVVGDRGVTLTLSTGEVVEARLAVGADGRKSTLRAVAGITPREWTYPQSALVANLRHAAPHDEESTEFHGPNGPFVLVPLQGRRSAFVLVEKPETVARLVALDDAALARELERRSRSLLGKLEIDGERQVYPLSGLTVASFGQRRVVLVGEAAHVFPPIGAQGLNLGLRDVAALGDVLDAARRRGDDPGSDAVTAAYDKARRLDVWTRTLSVDALNRTLMSSLLPAQLARGVGLWLAERVPVVRKLMMREGMVPSFATPSLMRGVGRS